MAKRYKSSGDDLHSIVEEEDMTKLINATIEFEKEPNSRLLRTKTTNAKSQAKAWLLFVKFLPDLSITIN